MFDHGQIDLVLDAASGTGLSAAELQARVEALVAQVEGLSAAQGVEIKDLARALLTRAGEGEIG